MGDTQTHASDEVQPSDDSMVRTYWEQCEAVGVAKDDRIAAAIISVHNRRRNTVRAMVRGLVLRYPLILGTSLARIDERLLELKTDGHLPPLDTMGWPDVINLFAGRLQHTGGGLTKVACQDTTRNETVKGKTFRIQNNLHQHV